MRRVALLARRVAVRFQNRVDKRPQRPDYRALPLTRFALRRFRPRQGLAHHSPVHSELVRHCPDRSNAKLVFSSDLLKQLHFRSLLHPSLPPLRQDPGLAGWGQFKVSKGAVSQYRNHKLNRKMNRRKPGHSQWRLITQDGLTIQNYSEIERTGT